MFSERFERLKFIFEATRYSLGSREISEQEAFDRAIQSLRLVKGIVYIIGNGGSAGIASHFSAELIKTLSIPSQTLFDVSLITCLANDLGYEHSFSNPLEKLLKPEDFLIAFSGSGKSPNILNAVEVAHSRGCQVMTFSGCKADNPLRKLGNVNFWVDCSEHGLIETTHFFLFHAIIDLWNRFSPQTVGTLSEISQR